MASPEQLDKVWQTSAVKATKARFEPYSMLQTKVKKFDKIGMFAINGTKFEAIKQSS